MCEICKLHYVGRKISVESFNVNLSSYQFRTLLQQNFEFLIKNFIYHIMIDSPYIKKKKKQNKRQTLHSILFLFELNYFTDNLMFIGIFQRLCANNMIFLFWM